MVLRSNHHDFQLTDITGIASHIYAADKSHPLIITITGFNFKCDVKTGDISREFTHVAGQIHQLMSEDQMGIYEYNIKLALELASRRELIARIQGLGDKKLNDVIPDQPSGPNSLSSMNELLIKGVLVAITRETKPASLLSRFGFNPAERSDLHKAVYRSLQQNAAHIKTYGDVEKTWNEITSHLQQQAAKPSTPAPKR